ncbi:MAG: malate dehydrogenase, partial [Thermoprotei archaeon]
WGIDSKGELTDNPNIVLKEGAVLPLGGLGEILGGHKGSGLALTIDILCGILTGANWGPYVGPKDKPANVGHFMVAINIEEFLPLQEFLERMEKLRTYIKSLPKHPKAKRIWIPGEKSWLTMQTRLKKGIPIHKAILNDIEKIARELNLKFELEDLRKRT